MKRDVVVVVVVVEGWKVEKRFGGMEEDRGDSEEISGEKVERVVGEKAKDDKGRTKSARKRDMLALECEETNAGIFVFVFGFNLAVFGLYLLIFCYLG